MVPFYFGGSSYEMLSLTFHESAVTAQFGPESLHDEDPLGSLLQM